MKKAIVMVLVLLASTLVFAEVFPNGERIVVDFFTRGSYIKIVKDKNNISFIAKATISGIDIDENDMEIATIGYNIMTGKNGDSESFNVKKWNIASDENGNIIITKK